MTGLDLEPFLRLLRADLGVWVSLAAVLLVLGVLVRTSWGSRRALRKCLVLSILAHVGLLLYSSEWNAPNAAGDDGGRERIQEIRVMGPDEADVPDGSPGQGGANGRKIADWDRPKDLSSSGDKALREARFDPRPTPPQGRTVTPDQVATPTVTPPDLVTSEPPRPDAAPFPDPATPTVAAAPARPDEIPEVAAPVVASADPDHVPERVRPDRPASPSPSQVPRPKLVVADRPAMPAPSLPTTAVVPPGDEPLASAPSDGPAPERVSEPPMEIARGPSPAAASMLPETDLRSRARVPGAVAPGRSTANLAPLTIARSPSSASGGHPLPAPANRPVAEVPEVYRERLDPDRAAKARRAGASLQSEQAVERALDWLSRHQDADGRWNAGTKKYSDDSVAQGDTNFTMHCPPGEVCSGECFYYEADTAMTGLALLSYLGAGYTHLQTDGKYATVMAKGLQYLLLVQKPNGDLRGESRAVGMYCHAMASLALCEAYALSGDERLRKPVERAVDFLIRSRAADEMSWRYQPGSPSGDTSLLGWAILVFKSAQEVGIAVPSSTRTGALGWLSRVAEGKDRGLAVYRPGEGPYGGAGEFVEGRNMTPTMTAEAWACRQFLGVGGPGPASDEAARYLLQNQPDRDHFNLYYWYYGTLAMFQRGGDDWSLWNVRVRDELVGFQKTSGHQAGSWDPKDSHGRYDTRGGRIYATALGAMTLEVYYRYLRLHDETRPPRLAPKPDPTLRRTGQPSPPPR